VPVGFYDANGRYESIGALYRLTLSVGGDAGKSTRAAAFPSSVGR
jgi:hypothetical protein